MAIVINGSTNVISGVAVGGLPDGIVDTDMLAANAVTAAKSSGLATTNGITMADLWRVTTDVSVSSGYNYLTANWERCDTGGFGQIGTGMTQSGGVFTFPSTGIYKLNFGIYARDDGSSSTNGVHIHTTTDGGSNYTFCSNAYFNISNISTHTYGFGFVEFIFDVTDVSTHKARFVVYSADSIVVEGNSNANSTYATFTRLGDT